MENLDALLAILHSSNLLLSLQGVQQPCEDPSVDSSSISELKEFLLSLALTQCPPAQCQESSITTEFFLCALLALLAECALQQLNALLAEFTELLCFCLLLNSQQSSSLCTPCTGSMPTWQSFTELKESFCLQLCSSPQPCLLRCSTTSRSSLS
jgi:hypothetical protein